MMLLLIGLKFLLWQFLMKETHRYRIKCLWLKVRHILLLHLSQMIILSVERLATGLIIGHAIIPIIISTFLRLALFEVRAELRNLKVSFASHRSLTNFRRIFDHHRTQQIPVLLAYIEAVKSCRQIIVQTFLSYDFPHIWSLPSFSFQLLQILRMIFVEFLVVIM